MKRLSMLLALLLAASAALAQTTPAQNKKKLPLHFKAAASIPAPRVPFKTGPYAWNPTYSPIGGVAVWPGSDWGNYLAGALDLNDSTAQQGPITITGLGISASHVTQAYVGPNYVPGPCEQLATWELWASAGFGGEQTLLYSFPVPNQSQETPYTGSFETTTRTKIAVPAGSYIMATYNLGYNSEQGHPCYNYFSQFTVQYTIP